MCKERKKERMSQKKYLRDNDGEFSKTNKRYQVRDLSSPTNSKRTNKKTPIPSHIIENLLKNQEKNLKSS